MALLPKTGQDSRKFITNSALPQKEEILQMIDLDEKDMDAKEKRIARLRWAPETYRFLLNECYPALRHSDYSGIHTVRGFNLDEAKRLSIPIRNS